MSTASTRWSSHGQGWRESCGSGAGFGAAFGTMLERAFAFAASTP